MDKRDSKRQKRMAGVVTHNETEHVAEQQSQQGQMIVSYARVSSQDSVNPFPVKVARNGEFDLRTEIWRRSTAWRKVHQ